MSLKLENYRKTLPAALLKLAGTLKIREFEEESKGKYLAFAEEGNQDFDVSVSISPKGEIEEHQCDCASKLPFCQHKAALLLHLSTGKVVRKGPVKRTRRRSDIELLLDEVSPEDLKGWLMDIFPLHKEIALLFKTRFNGGKQSFSHADSMKITQEVVKSVMKSRKNADKSESKKIASLWTQVHRPILDYYFSGPGEFDHFDAFAGVMESIIFFNDNVGKNYNDIYNYGTSIIREMERILSNLSNEEEWDQSISHYLREVAKPESRFDLFYLQRLLEISNTCAEPRKAKLLEKISIAAFQNPSKNEHTKERFQIVLLPHLIKEKSLFQRYFKHFNAAYYQPEYNSALAGALVEIREWTRAKKVCQDIIKSNSSESYNLTIYQYLKIIYTETGDKVNLLKIKSFLLPYNFSFNDYKEILSIMGSVEEARTFRNRIQAKARAAMTREGSLFLFELSLYEGDYKKVVRAITEYTPLEKILEHWDRLIKADMREFLRLLLTTADLHHLPTEREVYEKKYALVLDKMLKTMEPNIIRLAIKSYSSNWRTYPLMEYLKKRLSK